MQVAPSSGTVVWLHSLSSDLLNGQTALVIGATEKVSIESAAKGRCAVQLLKDNNILSVRRGNLSLCPLAYFCIKEAPEMGGLGVYATQDIAAGVDIFVSAHKTSTVMTRDHDTWHGG